jgi:hypothetical protein
VGPVEGSVAQRTAEAKARRHLPLPPARAGAAVVHATRRAPPDPPARLPRLPWVDLDAIEAEAAELLETDPAQAERFFGNRIVAGATRRSTSSTTRSLAERRP